MKRIAIILAAFLLLGTGARAAPLPDLSWNVVGGGWHAANDKLDLEATLGQAVAGGIWSSAVELSVGFWPGEVALYHGYLPLVLK